MNLKDLMQEKVFAVVGDTLKEEKYAYIIKHALLDKNYTVYSVGRELKSLNDIPEDIGVIDLCTSAKRGLALMQECTKSFKGIIIQPGAESPELIDFLKEKNYPFIEACVLVGLKTYT